MKITIKMMDGTVMTFPNNISGYELTMQYLLIKFDTGVQRYIKHEGIWQIVIE